MSAFRAPPLRELLHKHAASVLVSFVLCLLCGTIPGSTRVLADAQSPLHETPEAPENKGPRDARLDVVVKDVTGNNVQNAHILAYAMIAGRAHFSASRESDADGVARLDAMAHGEHYVVVEKPGFARQSAMVVLEAGARRLDVVLNPEHTLSVFVEDETHAPAARAVVEVSTEDPVPLGAQTDDAGHVLVGRLGAGPYAVRVFADGYEPVTREHVEEGKDVHITLAKLATLVVSVVDEKDAPVARANVTIASASLYPPRAAETDEGGRVRISGLTAGSYALRATRGGEVSVTELAITIGHSEEKNVTLKLGAGASAEVIVVDAETDDPIRGARVTLAEGGLSPFPLEAVTNKEGKAILGPFSPGSATITVRADGYVSKGGIDVTGASVKVPLGKGGAIEGRIVDARGFPIDGATFVVVGTDVAGGPVDDDPRARAFSTAHFDSSLGGPTPLVPAGELGVVPGPVPPIPHASSVTMSNGLAGNATGTSLVDVSAPWISARDGTFVLSPVTPGRVRVLARHPEYTDVFGEIVTLAPGGSVHVDLVMQRGGSIEGRVVDSRGSPVAGAEVTIAATHGSMERGGKTASDGSFAFASLPDVVTILVADAREPGEPLAREIVEVKEGAKVTVTITLPAPREALALRIVDERGQAVSGAIATAASIDPAQALHVTSFSGSDGELTLARAQDLALRIDLRAPGFASMRIRVDARKDPLRVALSPAVIVTGAIESDRGEAIANAEVTAYTELGAMHAVTDKDGAYRYTELGEGTVRVAARAHGFAPSDAAFNIQSSHGRPFSPPKIRLSVECVAEGIAVDDAGKPLAGARIAKDVVSTYLAVGSAPPTFALTARDGKFRLGELPAGDVTLEALVPDFGRGSAVVHLEQNRPLRDVRIVVSKSDDASSHEHAAGGVAVTLGEVDETKEVVIVAVAPSSEAERAGLLPNDVLLDIDGERPTTMKDARQKLSGPLADECVLKIQRADATLTFRVPREAIRK